MVAKIQKRIFSNSRFAPIAQNVRSACTLGAYLKLFKRFIMRHWSFSSTTPIMAVSSIHKVEYEYKAEAWCQMDASLRTHIRYHKRLCVCWDVCLISHHSSGLTFQRLINKSSPLVRFGIMINDTSTARNRKSNDHSLPGNILSGIEKALHSRIRVDKCLYQLFFYVFDLNSWLVQK